MKYFEQLKSAIEKMSPRARRRLKIISLFVIGLAILYFQKKINLVQGSDDTIFLEKAQSMSYVTFIHDRYMTWSSRVVAESLIYFFVKWDLLIWKVLNVLMIFLLAFSINRLFKKKVGLFDFIFVLLALGFIDNRILSSSTFCFHGSFNYSWPAATGLFALIYLADLFYRKQQTTVLWKKVLYAIAIVFTVLSNEQIGLVLLAFFALYIGWAKFRKVSLEKEVYMYFMLTLAVLMVAFLAPGNSVRYHAEIGRWYPDFQQISLLTHIKRNLIWLYEKLFIEQKYLILLLGIATSYFYYLKTHTRNYLLEIMTAYPILLLAAGNVDEFLFIFDKHSFAATVSYLFWTAYLIVLVWSFVKIDEKKATNGLLFAAGLCTVLLMWFSPTIYGSGNRVLLFFSIIMVVLINKMRIDSKHEINQPLAFATYAMFSLINMAILFNAWGNRFKIFY